MTPNDPKNLTASEKDQIVEKLMKLDALRQRAGSEAEAANAAMRIKELLDKYNMSAGVLTREEKRKGHEKIGMNFTAVIQKYDNLLAHAVCKVMDTLVYIRWERHPGKTRKVQTLVFVGLEANVEASVLTFKYFQESCYQMMHTRWVMMRDPAMIGRKNNESFRYGFAEAVYRNCEKLRNARMAELSKQIEGESMALVLVGNQVAKAYLEGLNLKKGKRSKPVNVNHDAYHKGLNDGSKVDPMAASSNRMLKG